MQRLHFEESLGVVLVRLKDRSDPCHRRIFAKTSNLLGKMLTSTFDVTIYPFLANHLWVKFISAFCQTSSDCMCPQNSYVDHVSVIMTSIYVDHSAIIWWYWCRAAALAESLRHLLLSLAQNSNQLQIMHVAKAGPAKLMALFRAARCSLQHFACRSVSLFDYMFRPLFNSISVARPVFWLLWPSLQSLSPCAYLGGVMNKWVSE